MGGACAAMTDDELRQIAWDFRVGLIGEAGSPEGMCFAVSSPLAGLLNFYGVPVELVESDHSTVLNIRPAFLIVPAALELRAEQLVAQNLVPATPATVVPQSIRSLSPISEPRLDAASPTAWYLAASPNQIDTIEYAYLEGQQGAYVETRNGFDVDGVEIKCRLDFGAKAIDWRGLYRNPGA
jgi:hypothetical protein